MKAQRRRNEMERKSTTKAQRCRETAVPVPHYSMPLIQAVIPWIPWILNIQILLIPDDNAYQSLWDLQHSTNIICNQLHMLTYENQTLFSTLREEHDSNWPTTYHSFVLIFLRRKRSEKRPESLPKKKKKFTWLQNSLMNSCPKMFMTF